MNDHQNVVAIAFESVKQCPLCGSPDRFLFEHESTPPEEIHLVRCSECEFVYTSAAVGAGDIARFYDGYNAARDAQRVDLREKRALMYKLDAAYARRFLQSGDARILDVGSGSGEFSAQFIDDFEVHGVEVDGAVRTACANAYPVFRLYPNLQAIPHDVVFDAIFFRGTLQYMPDLHDVANWCFAHLAGGGRLFALGTPNAESLLALLQREKWVLANKVEHRYWFTRRHLMQLFGDRFTLIAYDLPYLGTPYENYAEDLRKVLAMMESPAARVERVPFFGSMMNVVLRKS
jgi:SAM-dependent methyltransferase